MNALDLIAKRLAAPKAFRVVTTYADGRTRIHETETEAQAKNHAQGESANIGRDLIDRMTGETVRKVSVAVEAI